MGDFHGFKTLQEFLDHKQYTVNGILRYEKIFGAGFVSTGGVETTTKFLKTLDLKPNQKVLDVGCGIGGGDFMMAQVNLSYLISQSHFFSLDFKRLFIFLSLGLQSRRSRR